MNIKEAKEQIKYAMTAYFAKDDLGNYEIPAARQRPVFLLGAPGIGKTAIMEQIAEELDVLLITYSMTHHTRQSALGLPYIADKNYGGEAYRISEYTMSEIIASVYDAMEETGKKEGILFLDEINCVSETLTPSMLQFLQFKTFGRHKLPDGWLVVTAGNPPEYNRSVREFDIVTMDRLKKITVEPEFDVWKEYAWERSVHPAILSYLEIKKNHFYQVETGVGGKNFVTARGWEDLSQMIRLCEKKSLPVDGKLIAQYLQDVKIASDFASYYDLFQKYQSDYQIESILSGTASAVIKERAENARFDERIALLGLILDTLSDNCRKTTEQEDYLSVLMNSLKSVRNRLMEHTLSDLLHQETEQLHHTILLREKSGTLSASARRTFQLAIRFLDKCKLSCNDFQACKEAAQKETGILRSLADTVRTHFDQAFSFLEEVYPQGQEILIFVTELTINEITSRFISHYGCDSYYRHNKDLMFYERNKEIAARMSTLSLD